MRTSLPFFAGILLTVPLSAGAQAASQGGGALFVGNMADACVTSAMSAGILSALRDKGSSQVEAESKVAELLAKDPNRDFYVGLAAQNARVVFGFPSVPKSSQEQVALARCARVAKNKPSISDEAVAVLMPSVVKCQSLKDDAEINRCVFSAVYEASPQ